MTIKSFNKAAEKFKALGSLGVTAQDHKGIGSTPPKKLLENPGKTLGELMTDEEVIEWIKGNKEAIAQFSEADQNNSFVKSALPMLKEEVRFGTKYLKSLGRL